jgi:hypothetical protein
MAFTIVLIVTMAVTYDYVMQLLSPRTKRNCRDTIKHMGNLGLLVCLLTLA